MEALEIPVKYNNQELIFKANVVRFGYVHRIVVDIKGTQVTIERDEEGNYRALVNAEIINSNKLDHQLIEAIVGVLQAI